MGDRCYSTLVCAERDRDVFEKMGYRLEESQALSPDGNEIPGAVVMVDEEATNGNYDELTALTGIPFGDSFFGVQRLLPWCLRRPPHCFGWQGMALLRRHCMRAITPLSESNLAG